jgi:phytoene synthase
MKPPPAIKPTAYQHWSAQQVMSHHAKTFYWASRLLPSELRRDIEVLYAFCRTVDDLVDECADGAEQLESVLRDLDREQSDMPHIAAFLNMAERRGINLDCARELIHGARSDLEHVRIPDQRELLRYSYRVASTVGLMFCAVAEVRDPKALPYAIDLGVAMQLTNIARDVVEDFQRDRIYLPASWIEHQHVATAVGDQDSTSRQVVFREILHLIHLADDYYRSADRGLPFLPPVVRWAVLTASRTYEAIGKRIIAKQQRYWDGRVYTQRRYKLAWTLRAATVIGAGRLSNRPLNGHDASLHTLLAGLPHTNTHASEHSTLT